MPTRDCCCERPACDTRFLIQRIVGSGSCHERRVCECLHLEQIPRAAIPPYTLVCVSACAQAPWWEETQAQGRGMMQLIVTVPLTCTFTDANGNRFQSPATLTRRVCVRVGCGCEECWRYQMDVQACVRLSGCAPYSENGCFEAPLEVLIDVYVTAACAVGGQRQPECCFDDRPLFPQPCRPWR